MYDPISAVNYDFLDFHSFHMTQNSEQRIPGVRSSNVNNFFSILKMWLGTEHGWMT